MHNIKITHKNKFISQFHINACSLNKNFDELQHLLCCIKKHFDIIALKEKRTAKQVFLLNNLDLNKWESFIDIHLWILLVLIAFT